MFTPIFMEEEKSYYAHPTAIIDEGCSIGKGTRIWHFTHVMSGCVIGESCSFGQNVVVSPEVVLGRNVKVQNNVSIYTGVICEDDVFLGPSMVFTNVMNPRSAVVRRDQYRKTLVRKGASIGANATIICGITIGEYAFVGAGSVVNKDVTPFSLVIGNPARHIGWMSEYGHRLEFDKDGKAECPESGQKYELKEGAVKRIS
jgi:UDP-2-acetamido-3-amino-2,3-dideoxy-glucuronate N-acetyltransferase